MLSTDYVDGLKELLFTLPANAREDISTKYKDRVPAPINTHFPDRLGKEEAVQNYRKRKQHGTGLYPAGIMHKFHLWNVKCADSLQTKTANTPAKLLLTQTKAIFEAVAW